MQDHEPHQKNAVNGNTDSTDGVINGSVHQLDLARLCQPLGCPVVKRAQVRSSVHDRGLAVLSGIGVVIRIF